MVQNNAQRKVQNGVHHSVHMVPGLGARWCLTPELLVSSPNQRLHTWEVGATVCTVCRVQCSAVHTSAWEVAQGWHAHNIAVTSLDLLDRMR